jgi:hypothetical protein
VILPTKHISLETSLLGLGAKLLSDIDRPRSVTGLWEVTKGDIGSFERFVLALDFLFALNTIEFRDGLLVRSR